MRTADWRVGNKGPCGAVTGSHVHVGQAPYTCALDDAAVRSFPSVPLMPAGKVAGRPADLAEPHVVGTMGPTER